MGLLVDGKWSEEEVSFEKASLARDWVTADGSPGPTGQGGFKAEAGRYHLYVAVNCPWAHRTMMARSLKGLRDVVSMSETSPVRTKQGWVFRDDEPQYQDQLLGFNSLHEVYSKSDSRFTGRVSVPVLWDKERQVMVNNESAEIFRMLNNAFDEAGASGPDLYPEDQRCEIDEINQVVLRAINSGVYRTGSASSQAAYDEATGDLFDTLDMLDARLGEQRYLVGNTPTEADWLLFPTLVRFDVGYYSAFRCNKKRIVDYPNLWAYCRDLYQMPGIAETTDLDQYRHYFHSAIFIQNALGIIPAGPNLDFDEPVGPRPGD